MHNQLTNLRTETCQLTFWRILSAFRD